MRERKTILTFCLTVTVLAIAIITAFTEMALRREQTM